MSLSTRPGILLVVTFQTFRLEPRLLYYPNQSNNIGVRSAYMVQRRSTVLIIEADKMNISIDKHTYSSKCFESSYHSSLDAVLATFAQVQFKMQIAHRNETSRSANQRNNECNLCTQSPQTERQKTEKSSQPISHPYGHAELLPVNRTSCSQ